ncbi:hypothetical protein ACM66B_000297 [Microbotryomycetes sp. NB124-2]
MSVTASSSSSMYDGSAPHPASLLMSLKAGASSTGTSLQQHHPTPPSHLAHPTTTALAAAAAAAAAAASAATASTSTSSPSGSSSRAPKGDLVEFYGEDRCGSCCRANKQVCVALLKNGNRRRTCSQCQRDKKACDKYERYDSDGKLITKVQTTKNNVNNNNNNNSNNNAAAGSPDMAAAAVLSASPVMKPNGALPSVLASSTKDSTVADNPNNNTNNVAPHQLSPVIPANTTVVGRGSPQQAKLAPPPPTQLYNHQQQQQDAAMTSATSLGAPQSQTSPFHYHLWQPPASVNMNMAQQQQQQQQQQLPSMQQAPRPQPPSQSASYQGSTSSSVAATPPAASSLPLAPIVTKSSLEVERMRNQLLGEVCDSMLSVLNKWSSDERDFSGPRQFVKRVTQECGTALRRPELLDRAKVNEITRKLESALRERQQALGGDDVVIVNGHVGGDVLDSANTAIGGEDAPPAGKRRRLSSDASGRGSVPSKRSLSVEESDSKPQVRLLVDDDEERDELESNQ